MLLQCVIFPVVARLGSQHQQVCSSACDAALSIAHATSLRSASREIGTCLGSHIPMCLSDTGISQYMSHNLA